MVDDPSPTLPDRFADGWKSHALGQPLAVDAADDFKRGWLARAMERRPTLMWAEPHVSPDWLADVADRIDL